MLTTPAMEAADVPQRTAGAPVPWVSWACLAATGVIILYPLSYEWTFTDNYAFGWWVPILALFLLWERWESRPVPVASMQPAGLGRFLLAWGLLLFSSRMVLEPSLVSPPPLWGLALLYISAVLYWLWLYGGITWARHFAFPICFLLLAVPWPGLIETPFEDGLARVITWIVAHVLIDFGILAQAAGNVIVLANTTLGVEEACSGIRSFHAALMISFLLGEIYRFNWSRRLRVVLLAVVVALAGNFLRTLFLALMASAYGAKVMSHWHDTAGACILVLTSLTTWLICHFFRQKGERPPPTEDTLPRPEPQTSPARALRFACWILVIAVTAESATQGWYGWKELKAAYYPMWTAVPPSTEKIHRDNVPEQSKDILKYDAGWQVDWQDERSWNWTLYWFRYHPKPWGSTLYEVHNPDNCLPAAGFKRIQDYDMFTTRVNGMDLRVHPKLFQANGKLVYVFWLVYANRGNYPLEKASRYPAEDPGSKVLSNLRSIWNGTRASTAETESLEAIITGPQDYASAEAAYLALLQKVVVPDAVARNLTKPQDEENVSDTRSGDIYRFPIKEGHI